MGNMKGMPGGEVRDLSLLTKMFQSFRVGQGRLRQIVSMLYWLIPFVNDDIGFD